MSAAEASGPIVLLEAVSGRIEGADGPTRFAWRPGRPGWLALVLVVGDLDAELEVRLEGWVVIGRTRAEVVDRAFLQAYSLQVWEGARLELLVWSSADRRLRAVVGLQG